MQSAFHSVSYEVHRYHGGRWELDSTYDDRELALEVARRLRGSSRYRGVRVIKEWYDEETGRLLSQVISKELDLTKTVRGPAHAAAPAHASAHEAAHHLGESAPRHPPLSPVRARPQEPVRLILTFCGIVLLGIAAIIGLRALSTML